VSGETLTFADVEGLTRAAGSAMVKLGMVKGEVALYMTSDVTRIYTTILGIWRVGGVVYSSYPEDTTDTLVLRIKATTAKWIFCDPASLPQVQTAITAVDWFVQIIVFGQSEDGTGGTMSIDKIYEDDGNGKSFHSLCITLDSICCIAFAFAIQILCIL
jgi:acyl-coenzyme A synthetase/AMP-(fatty) acid ligase